MARTPTAAQVLGHVVLVTGKEEYLSARTVASVRDAVRAHDAEAELAESTAADLTLASLGEMSAPSLFSSIRCVVVRGLEDLPDESVDGLLAYCAAPADDVALVLVHSGGAKGSGVLAKLRKLAAVTEVKSEEVRAGDMPSFVTAEVASHGSKIASDAAAFLVQAVGNDLRSLAAAADQLTNDYPGEQLTVEKVQRYFGGRAEAKSFTVADAAFSGKRALGARGAAVGPRHRHRRRAGHLGDGGLGAQPGALPGLVARRPRRRPRPRAGRAAVEGAHRARPVARVDPRGHRARRSGRSRRPTPTSRARPTTRPTRWSGSCSPSPALRDAR